MKTIAVLGGGLCGLAAAEALVRQGHPVTVFEAAARTGGFIHSVREDGWLAEAGPNSFQESTAELRATLERLGLGPERIEAAPAAQQRYLVRDGKLVALPLAPPALLASRLFSWGAKLTLARELFRRPLARPADLSVADFVREHFGSEILDYAVQPFVSGIYAGDPATLSVRHAFPTLAALERSHGSLLRGQGALARARRAAGRGGLPPVISFRSGIGALISAYQAQLPADCVRTGATVTALEPGERWTVVVQTAAGAERRSFDAVVCTLPAPALAKLSIGGATPLAGLGEIPHPPIASLFLGYRREQVRHPLDGFGVLVPAVEQRSLLGALFSSTLFPGRAPPGHVAITAMAGGALAPHLARLGPEELLEALRPDLESLLGVAGRPVYLRHSAWPSSIPQYTLGHERHLAAIAATEAAHPGLAIGGMVRDGISLPAAIAAGERLAARARSGAAG